jgi:hypothetical protein
MAEDAELLAVVSEAGNFPQALVALNELGTVTTAMPPRLVVVAVPAEAGPLDLSRLPITVTCYQSQPPVSLVEAMTEPELLFVSGWLARAELRRRHPRGMT